MPAAVALAAFPAFYDSAGNPLSGGKLYSYEAGTTTPLASYTDQSGTVANANPVILDSAGRAAIWLTVNSPYKLVLKTAADVTLVTIDNFYGGADPAQLVAAGIVPATGGTYSGPVVFEGGVDFAGDAAENLATLNSLGIAAVRNANLYINSDMQIWQRAVASVADGAYGFDRVVNLCDTGSTTLSQLAQPEDGMPYAMRILQPDAGAKRIGCVQIVEARNCLAYRGKNLVFTARVRCSAATTVRAALVAWTGTADAPTRDVVSNWASTTYTAGNFFVANTAPIAVAASALSAATWTDITVSSASAGGVVAPSTMNNLYMVIWTDQTIAQNVTLDVSQVNCGQGTGKQLWTPPDAQQELARCQRYYFTGGGGSLEAYNTAGQVIRNVAYFPVTMRIAPTVTPGFTYSNTSTGSIDAISTSSFRYAAIVTGTGSAIMQVSWTASADL